MQGGFTSVSHMKLAKQHAKAVLPCGTEAMKSTFDRSVAITQ
jgi:hypothetical protein